jgi:hypothetical protein
VTVPKDQKLKALIKERYEYRCGCLWNRVTLNSRAVKGDMAGHLDQDKRRPSAKAKWVVRIEKRNYLESHLVWLWHHGRLPKADLEHLDGDPLNSAIENLREYDHRQRPTRPNRLNKSGYPGVNWDKRNNRWRAEICVNKRTINLGRFDEWDDAVDARKAADIEHGRAPK